MKHYTWSQFDVVEKKHNNSLNHDKQMTVTPTDREQVNQSGSKEIINVFQNLLNQTRMAFVFGFDRKKANTSRKNDPEGSVKKNTELEIRKS